jgi:CheY-like chemotaxis protein
VQIMSFETRSDRTGTNATTVLIVDDDEDNADVLEEMARRHGFCVRKAHHGIEALLRLEEECADVVVLDLGIPEIDGYELAAMIRKRWGGAVRLVALTGLAALDMRRGARADGFDAFLVKPISPDEFVNALGSANRLT